MAEHEDWGPLSVSVLSILYSGIGIKVQEGLVKCSSGRPIHTIALVRSVDGDDSCFSPRLHQNERRRVFFDHKSARGREQRSGARERTKA